MARLSRRAVVTEKIDGTNACVYLERKALVPSHVLNRSDSKFIAVGDMVMAVASRNKWITPNDDNMGFARWAYENAACLAHLGPGRHFGEWWGSGIQRGYNLPKGEKRFSLFNTGRWTSDFNAQDLTRFVEGENLSTMCREVSCCHVVPVLGISVFSSTFVDDALAVLQIYGSRASPGFKKPEGVVVYHEAANICFKKLLEKDELPKGLAK